MGKINAICISKRHGTAKKFVDAANFITEFGIDGDAHAGDWHRQVSFLGQNESTTSRLAAQKSRRAHLEKISSPKVSRLKICPLALV